MAGRWPRLRQALDPPVRAPADDLGNETAARQAPQHRATTRSTGATADGAAAHVHTVAAHRKAVREREAMTPTLRRLNDRERYYGLTWPGWVALAAAGGILYGAVRVSPSAFARP